MSYKGTPKLYIRYMLGDHTIYHTYFQTLVKVKGEAIKVNRMTDLQEAVMA